MGGNDVGRVAGHEQAFDCGMAQGQFAGEVAAVHAGHDDVGEEQVDRAGMGIGEGDGFGGGWGGEDGIAQGGKKGSRKGLDGGFVFDEQDANGRRSPWTGFLF